MKQCPKCGGEYPDRANVCPLDGTKLNMPPAGEPKHVAQTPTVKVVPPPGQAPVMTAPPQKVDPLIGTILDERYRLISQLGEGGMGTVYLAQHTTLQRNLAVKVLLSEIASDGDAVARFKDEARATSQIGHENIIEVTDFGRTPSGSFYFVMEYLPGINLAEMIVREKLFSPQRAMNIAGQIAAALAAAHKCGIVHRDLKPENIHLTKKGDATDFVKVLDFGIAKIKSMKTGGSARRTTTGMILGTPAFMSPEQAAGGTIDARTDMYSLGVIMYEMTTGRIPFDSENPVNILLMHQTHPPAPPRSIKPEIPVSVEHVILRCLAKLPEHRYQTMEELETAIKAAETERPAVRDDSSYLPSKSLTNDEIDRNRSKLFMDPNEVWYDQPNGHGRPTKQAGTSPAAAKSQGTQSQAGQSQTEQPPQSSPDSGPPPPPAPLELSVEPVVVKRDLGKRSEITREAFIGDLKARQRSKHKPIIVGAVLGVVLLAVLKIYVFTGSYEDHTSAGVAPPPATYVSPGPPPQVLNEQVWRSVDQKIVEAEALFKKGKLEEAATAFKEIIRDHPTFPRAYRGLGDTFIKMGREDVAMKYYEKYLDLHPGAPDAMEVRAIVNRIRGR
ncbi:MAG: protein kinase [Myxococcota bacterium]|jgi:serine/threonine protein kinase